MSREKAFKSFMQCSQDCQTNCLNDRLYAYIAIQWRMQWWGSGPPPPAPACNIQVAIGFLRNSGTDPLEKQLDPMGPIASPERSVPLSMNCDDDCENNIFRTTLMVHSTTIARSKLTRPRNHVGWLSDSFP